MELDRDEIVELFEISTHQFQVWDGLYRMVFPNLETIEKLDGYPRVNDSVNQFLFEQFIRFDQEHHRGVLAGVLWMGKGFASDREVQGWDVVPCGYTLKKVCSLFDTSVLRSQVEEAKMVLAEIADEYAETFVNVIAEDWEGVYIPETVASLLEIPEPTEEDWDSWVKTSWAWEVIDEYAEELREELVEILGPVLEGYNLMFGTVEGSCDYGLILAREKA